MKLKLICCEVFMREACMAIATSNHTVDPEFTPKGAHEDPNRLRATIQGKIDMVKEDDNFDAIVLGFGLCGNAADGLIASSVPLVIPRAHDCCTIFLGSKEKFEDNFKDNRSAEWGSTGYMERGGSYLRSTDTGVLLGLDKNYEDFVELYGEENAEYLWETLHPEVKQEDMFFIDIPELSYLGYKEIMEEIATKKGKELKVIEGDMRLIKKLINGDWNEDEFLYVPKGNKIKPVYDFEKIMELSI